MGSWIRIWIWIWIWIWNWWSMILFIFALVIQWKWWLVLHRTEVWGEGHTYVLYGTGYFSNLSIWQNCINIWSCPNISTRNVECNSVKLCPWFDLWWCNFPIQCKCRIVILTIRCYYTDSFKCHTLFWIQFILLTAPFFSFFSVHSVCNAIVCAVFFSLASHFSFKGSFISMKMKFSDFLLFFGAASTRQFILCISFPPTKSDFLSRLVAELFLRLLMKFWIGRLLRYLLSLCETWYVFVLLCIVHRWAKAYNEALFFSFHAIFYLSNTIFLWKSNGKWILIFDARLEEGDKKNICSKLPKNQLPSFVPITIAPLHANTKR